MWSVRLHNVFDFQEACWVQRIC